MPEASGSAGHRYESSKCSVENVTNDVKEQLKAGSKLVAGAHCALYIKGTGSTKLVMTGNTFTGLKNCDAAAAVEISGIADVKDISDNKVDTNDAATKIKVGHSTSPTGFSKK